MNKRNVINATIAAFAVVLASCGGGGPSAFPDAPKYNQTSLVTPQNYLQGSSKTEDFKGSLTFSGDSLLYAFQNTVLSAGPYDKDFSLDSQINKNNLDASLAPTPTGTNGVDNQVQITGFDIYSGQRVYCVNVAGDVNRQPEAFAMVGTETINLGTDLPATENHCSGITMDTSGNLFVATNKVQATKSGTTGTVGSETIYRRAPGAISFSSYWSGAGQYHPVDANNVAIKENPADPNSADAVRDYLIGAIRADGNVLYWTGSYINGVNNQPNDSVLGIANYSTIFEASTSTIVTGGTEQATTSALGRDVVLVAAKIQVLNGNKIYFLHDSSIIAGTYSGLNFVDRAQLGRPVNAVSSGVDCTVSFGIRQDNSSTYACYQAANKFLTKLAL